MNIVFSEHARLKLRQRGITSNLVRKAIIASDVTVHAEPPREQRYRRFGRKYLKVVVAIRRRVIVVVTAHWVRNMPL